MTATAVTFHVSLNVGNLDRAIAFYRILFGVEPAKCHDDYAKFEIEDPAVIFSLVPRTPGKGGALSHLGFRLRDLDALEQARLRLVSAGLIPCEQDGTVCGYARQAKFWVTDPDGNFWELYVLHEELDPETVRRSLDGPVFQVEEPVVDCGPQCDAGSNVWEHHLTAGDAAAIPELENSLDESRLIGTFNAALAAPLRQELLRKLFRALKPGGNVVAHALMADRTLPGSQPRLPGLAALVARVPSLQEAIDELTDTGFLAGQVLKCTDKPWFVHEGIGLREVKLSAVKPSPEVEPRRVIYKGPFAEVSLEPDIVLPRGQRVRVPAAVWQALRQSVASEQFVFLDPDTRCGTAQTCGVS